MNRPARQCRKAAGGVGPAGAERGALADSATPSSSAPAVSRLLTPPETSTYLRVAERTLTDWRYRGEGPKFYKVGSRVRYKQADLDEWLEAVAVNTA